MESPPPALNLRTTRQVIAQSSLSFLSNVHVFLFLSFLLFSFRNAVDSGTLFLTSFIERDPSVQSLISRLSADPPRQLLPAKASALPDSVRSAAAWNHHRHHRRRRPFLHLSRVGTLDDDFFSDDIDDDRSLFAFSHQSRSKSNGSFVRFAPFMPPGKVDGFRVLEIGGPGFVLFADDDVAESNNADDEDRRLDLRLFGRGFNFDRHEAATLLYLVSLISGAYGWIVLGFLFTYCFVLGTVFLTVVNSILQSNYGYAEGWPGHSQGRMLFDLHNGEACNQNQMSVAEVYFMIVWLVFYFSARTKEAELDGRRFGRRELEDSNHTQCDDDFWFEVNCLSFGMLLQ
ncbi:hypothetical protein H6P81_011768 [Aristolochia fimbriata]|uniref:Uncharacterized protein n=1 Tax=Aristolochia fimbriata TaxID=158543 RepID=A0AAV7E9W9_ARIFI|nr:hypothetical protein H6P81_011768 [Aristolochia fimbriata]